MAITRDERRELRRLVEETFAYLRQELAAREREAREIIRQRILTENTGNLNVAERTMKEALDIIAGVNIEVRSERKYGDAVELSDFTFEPIDLHKRIEDELAALRDEAEKGHISLKQEELRIKREITLDAISSAEAKVIIERIPDIDQLMPVPQRVLEG